MIEFADGVYPATGDRGTMFTLERRPIGIARPDSISAMTRTAPRR